ncbi:hypothetical protein V8E55_003271 [Tylopilus felleus]
MAPRRTDRTSPHQSSSKRKKGKERVTDTEGTSHSGSNGSQSAAKSGQSTHCQWSHQDEESLLEHISARKGMMADGQMVWPVFWSDVAKDFPPPLRGTVKTADNCREKWKRMKSIFEVVHKIANTSGLAYSPESGANIGPESQQIWDDIVKVSLSL